MSTRSKHLLSTQPLRRALAAATATVGLLTCMAPLHARITKIVIDEKVSPAFCQGTACSSFGDTGPYEQIAGRAFGELDPRDPLNAIVLAILLMGVLLFPDFVAWHKVLHSSQGSYHSNDFSAPAFVQSLFLAQVWTFIKPGTWNEPSWTLSAEVLGYCVFPLVANFAAKQISAGRMISFCLVGLGLFVVLMAAGGHMTNNPSGVFGIVRLSFCFFAGVCASRAFQLIRISSTSASWITILSALQILLCFWWEALGIFSVFGFVGLIFGLAYQSGPVNHFLSSRPMLRMGRISFSFYLIHLIPIEVFAYLSETVFSGSSVAGKAVLILAGIFVPYILALLAYKYIESPCQSLGREVMLRVPVAHATIWPAKADGG